MPPKRAGARTLLLFLSLVLAGGTVGLICQELTYSRPPNIANGRRIYNSGCNVCHGPDGKGAPLTSTEFKRPDTFPDFTACSQTTPEPNMNWKAVIVHGGTSRGFSTIMPSFSGVLSYR